jgi:hypothetical protein
MPDAPAAIAMLVSMADCVLYFPMIDPPENAWFSRVLLYWDKIGTIMSAKYSDDYAFLRPYTTALLREELLTVVPPDWTLLDSGATNFETAFLELVDSDPFGVLHAEAGTREWASLHVDKTDTVLASHLEPASARTPGSPRAAWRPCADGSAARRCPCRVPAARAVVQSGVQRQRPHRGRQAELGLDEQRERAHRRPVGASRTRRGLRGGVALGRGQQRRRNRPSPGHDQLARDRDEFGAEDVGRVGHRRRRWRPGGDGNGVRIAFAGHDPGGRTEPPRGIAVRREADSRDAFRPLTEIHRRRTSSGPPVPAERRAAASRWSPARRPCRAEGARCALRRAGQPAELPQFRRRAGVLMQDLGGGVGVLLAGAKATDGFGHVLNELAEPRLVVRQRPAPDRPGARASIPHCHRATPAWRRSRRRRCRHADRRLLRG